MNRLVNACQIFDAWSDEEWVNDGADVRVSLICFSEAGHNYKIFLDGKPATSINADLSDGGYGDVDITKGVRLAENKDKSFFGLCLAGAFDVSEADAQKWLTSPNPNGKSNSDVLRPLRNGNDIQKRSKDRWVIDYGATMGSIEASYYEAPFKYVVEHVKPTRITNNRKARADKWWRHGEARPGLRRALAALRRYIATVETSKHRIFVWLPLSVAPEHKLIVIPRDDDTSFGILSSSFHVLWATRAGGRLGVGNDPVYNTSLCFEKFPFPQGLTPNILAVDYAADPRAIRIAAAAVALNEARERWLNPPEWTDRVPEVVAGYPDRIIAKAGHEAELKKRTLTNLYNARPAWLDNLHCTLDEAVAAAYGWDWPLTDDDILARLFVLNQARAPR